LKHSTSGETITIPAHRPLKVGTLRAILRDIEEITGLSLDTIVEAIQ
jgi:predicted RNA binding protein YcfA (HicA-like mRNA interferase family)